MRTNIDFDFHSSHPLADTGLCWHQVDFLNQRSFQVRENMSCSHLYSRQNRQRRWHPPPNLTNQIGASADLKKKARPLLLSPRLHNFLKQKNKIERPYYR
eukprot:Pompholyxophrys_punicea_v1_NODE_141_length_3246_cov_17.156064.p4 type:complete len:100 gc:universal NODE_141_length_3246_cov_17.156064:1712-2011(+)